MSDAPGVETRLPGRNERCPCGSGKKYKKCHGAPGRRRTTTEIKVAPQPTTTPVKLPGLPGTQTYLIVQPIFRGSDPRNRMSPGGSPGMYRVVFTLSRPGHAPHPDRSFFFEEGLEGDSHLAIAPPAYAHPGTAPHDPVLEIALRTVTPEGSFRFQGVPNKKGFLGKIATELQADSHKHAEVLAIRALSSALSNISVYHDIPLHIHQIDVTELATGTFSMTVTLPWKETPLFALPVESMSPDFRFYASLYREAADASSPAYQLLCYYKIIEGIRKRHERAIVEARKQGLPIPCPPREYVPAMRDEQVAWLDGLFPVRQKWDDDTLEKIFPREAVGRKLNDVTDDELYDMRNRVAHAVLRSGEATTLIDDGDDRSKLGKWLPLTKCIARALLRNEFPDVFLTEPRTSRLNALPEIAAIPGES